MKIKLKDLYSKFIECNNTICTDTRNIIKGSIFIALKGENFDGNLFAEEALEQGAKYALVQDESLSIKNERIFFVKNTLFTLQKLANFHRRKFDIPVIGITGSNGKTTTKELIATVLKKKYNVLVTEGNLNNHLGVPFTLLKLRAEHDIAVIEMGANKIGDIEELCNIASPNYGIITNIGIAHIEGFGTYENVLQTKLELYAALEKTNGVAFINADDTTLLKNAPAINIVTYGAKGQVKSQLKGMTPELNFEWQFDTYSSPTIPTKMIGAYNLANYTAAALIGYYFDVSPEDISAALSEYTPENNRSQINKTAQNTVIMDCYNANVTSMTLAIKSLSEMDAPNKLAILGDMKELGNISDNEHLKINALVKDLNLNAIYIGSEFYKLAKDETCYENVNDFISNCDTEIFKDFLILLKGSRSIQLEKIIQEDLL